MPTRPFRPFAAQVGFQRLEPGAEQPVPNTTEEALIAGLATMNQALADILTELREQVQRGIVYPVTLTTTGLIVVEVQFYPALFSLGITNDGPGTIQYRIPNTGMTFWVDLRPTEIITFNFIKGRITSVGFRAVAANGTIRAVGAY